MFPGKEKSHGLWNPKVQVNEILFYIELQYSFKEYPGTTGLLNSVEFAGLDLQMPLNERLSFKRFRCQINLKQQFICWTQKLRLRSRWLCDLRYFDISDMNTSASLYVLWIDVTISPAVVSRVSCVHQWVKHWSLLNPELNLTSVLMSRKLLEWATVHVIYTCRQNLVLGKQRHPLKTKHKTKIL